MEFKKPRTIYDQIADHICENILLDRWPAGERIPSVREMAIQAEVNPNTVTRAYTSLQELEIIVNQRGKGYFVAADSREKVRKMKRTEFVQEDLPALVKTMELLGISPDELADMIEMARETRKDFEDETER
ncbi:MAG: GntR family transcriptional regulator [Chitinivibrionales bacterium]|nr:GntR family transcriptional regulator [Chitinivibrionales bacterium]